MVPKRNAQNVKKLYSVVSGLCVAGGRLLSVSGPFPGSLQPLFSPIPDYPTTLTTRNVAVNTGESDRRRHHYVDRGQARVARGRAREAAIADPRWASHAKSSTHGDILENLSWVSFGAGGGWYLV